MAIAKMIGIFLGAARTTGGAVATFFRITADGDRRVDADGNNRIHV